MRLRFLDWALIALAITARAAAVLVLQSHTVPNSTYEHGEIAANLLAAGRGLSTKFLGAEGPTSQQAPIYPLIVAGAYALGGVGTSRALLILELGQAVLGGLLVAGVLRLGREVAPRQPSVSLAAGLIVALHPTLVYAATHVQVALLAATTLVWTLFFAYKLGRTGQLSDAVLAGLGLAGLALTDPILALARAGMAWAVVMGRSWHGDIPKPLAEQSPTHPAPSSNPLPPCGGLGWGVPSAIDRATDDVSPRRTPHPNPPPQGGRGQSGLDALGGWRALVRPIAVITAVAAVGVTPWLVRNYRVHGEFVAIKSTFGYAFWQGNCTLSRGTDKVVRESVERALGKSGGGLKGLNASLWAARHEAGYIDDIALTRADYRELGSVSEPERSRRLFRRALAELGAEPGRYAMLCAWRLRAFVLFDETNPKTRNLVYRASHLGLTALALLGLVLMPGTLRGRLGPTLLTAALVALFHTLTIVSARFHIPIEPLLGLWAAGGLARFANGVPSGGRGLHRRDSAPLSPPSSGSTTVPLHHAEALA